MFVVWQVVDDDIECFLLRVCSAQAFERCEKIGHALSFMDRPCKAVTVNSIEPKELFGAGQSAVGRAEPLWMPNSGPMLTMDGFEFQRSPFIETQNHTVLWSPMIEFKNAVLFSRTLGPEISSNSSSVVSTDPVGEVASVPIRY